MTLQKMTDQRQRSTLLQRIFLKKILIAKIPALQDKVERTYVLLTVCRYHLDTIGRAMPNTPDFGCIYERSLKCMSWISFLDNMKKVLSKFPQKIIDANMEAITRAYNEVK